jgi:hypothetical protein
MDDFFKDEAFQDLLPPAFVQDVTSREIVQLLERIVNDSAYGRLIHVPKQAVVTVSPKPRPIISNNIERYGTLWRRLKLIVFLDDWDPDDGGFLELFHVEPRKEPILKYHIPPKQNRMVLFETHPHTYVGASPVLDDISYRYLSLSFYTHETPEWCGHGSVETRMERPLDD